jgi:hypothetical protein
MNTGWDGDRSSDSEANRVERVTHPPRTGGGRRRLSRRVFLRRVVAALGLGGASFGVAELASAGTIEPHPRRRVAGPRLRPHPPAVRLTALPGGAVVPTAAWVQRENARPGTVDWVVSGHQTPRAIEGFADVTSAQAGTDVTLFVNTAAPAFHVEAYRMGYYQGLGARLVWTSDQVPGVRQPAPEVGGPSTNTVQCDWAPSLTVPVDTTWPPGAYLLKLVGGFGQQQYHPHSVRDATSTAAFVVQHSVTTWQAYNLWGGYSLYNGVTAGGLAFGQTTEGKDFAHRARIVSFDRPYSQDWAQGAADFIGNEFPLIFHMESLGLDLTYWTDVDLHERPELLTRHRCLFSLGHDEYWSLAMRNGALTALDLGVNLGFLGANACYRQIRFEPSTVGPDRHQVCYKSAAEDPLSGKDDAVVTGPEWAAPPTSWPESQLIGNMYQDVAADADLVVGDPSSWVWAGTGVTAGQKLPHVIQGEYDRFDSSLPGPPNVEIMAHSPVTNRGPGRFSDVTWYTTFGGGGVFATGNASWVNKLSNTTAFPTNVVPAAIPGVTEILLGVMENVYAVLGVGLGSANQPSRANAALVAPGSEAPPPPPSVTA